MENYDSIFTDRDPSLEKTFAPFDKEAWAAKKQEERQSVYQMIDRTAEDVAKDSMLFQASLDVMSRFDLYSVGNILLITVQAPEATKLADFDTWKENRAYVRKGEDHIKLLEPGEEFRREDGSTGVNYNVKQVFDISQTSAKARPAAVNHDIRLLLKAMLHSAPCPVEISSQVPEGFGAVYIPTQKKILVRQGMDGPDIFRSLAQELAHANMDRGSGYSRNQSAFTAYCSAYTLCKRFGVDAKSFSFRMVPDALGQMDAQTIRGELGKIRECAKQISLDMSRVLNSRTKEKTENTR